MNSITQAVISYKISNSDLDFLPIWKHFEPKIQYMSYRKSTQVPVDSDILYEAAVEGLLLAIKNFDFKKKCEFSTYFYTWARSKMLKEIVKTNRPKRVINIMTTSLYVEMENSYSCDDLLLPIIDQGLNPEEQLIVNEIEEVV